MKSATTHSSRHHQNTQTLLLATLNSDTTPVPSHILCAGPILGTNLHPQEQRSRQFSPRSSLTLEFPAPQRTRTIQVPRARFLPKKPVKIVPFARIPGQTSPANLEAINELCQKARGWKVAGYLEDDAGGSEVGDRGVERGGAVGADGRDGEERHSGSSDKFSASPERAGRVAIRQIRLTFTRRIHRSSTPRNAERGRRREAAAYR